MRILFQSNSRGNGGAERWLELAARGMASRGHEVLLASPPDGFIGADLANVPGLTQLRTSTGPHLRKRTALEFVRRWPANARQASRFFRTMKDEGIDVVHFGQTSEQLLGTAAAVEADIPVVWTQHGPLPDLLVHSPGMAMMRRAARRTAAVHCVADFTRRHLLEIGLSAPRYEVIYHGTATRPPNPARVPSLRAELDIADGDLVVGTVCRFAWTKGLDTMLEAFASALKARPRTVLLLVGDGEIRPDLEAQAAQLGIERRVRFTGFRSDVPDLLGLMDVFLMTSVEEGLPFTLIEAMAAGLPVISTIVGGTPEIVVDEETGLLVEIGDVAAITRALDRLLRESTARQRMGTAGGARVAEEFTLNVFFARLERLFQNAIANA